MNRILEGLHNGMLAAPFRAWLVSLLWVAAACAVNPATGGRQFMLMSENEEIEMGREADGQVTEAYGLYGSEELQTFVRDMGEDLAAQSERPRLPWSFKVVDDPIVNAFALPGGFIFITRGILASLSSEAELAGVLGHEIGHVTARHSASQLSRQQLQQLGLGVGSVLSSDFASAAGALSAGLQILNLKYGRGDETQSDELGVRYMSRAGYDPNALVGVFQALALAAGGGGRLPEWQSTHPDPENRQARIRELVAGSGRDYSGFKSGRDEYLRRLDGLIYGANPREGFFEGSLFRHPEMAFAIDFPVGWKTANQKSQVVGVAEDETAVVVLTLASGQSGVDAAMSAFMNREGIYVGDVRRVPVNGLEAREGSFEAQTDDGRYRGRVLFVEHGGAVVRILGYANASRWPGHERNVVNAARSFRPEVDPGVLRVEPARLEIVRLPSTMTFSEFTRRYPSTLGAEKLADLNRRALDDVLDAGTLVKRVTGGRLP